MDLKINFRFSEQVETFLNNKARFCFKFVTKQLIFIEINFICIKQFKIEFDAMLKNY